MAKPPIDYSLPSAHFDKRRYQSSYCSISVIMHSRGRPGLFAIAIESLVKTCTAIDDVEIIMKLDADDTTLSQYLEILAACPFSAKVLVYDRMEAYWSLYICQNDLSRIANGDILWLFNEDNEIITGDWVKAFKESRDVYSDNIYVCNVPGHSPKIGKCVSPAYTQEWFNVMQIVSPHVFSDRFLCQVAGALGRLLSTPLIAAIQFTHRVKEKIARPPINFGKGTLTRMLDNQVKLCLPVFRAAIISATSTQTTTTTTTTTTPMGAKVGPGYTESGVPLKAR